MCALTHLNPAATTDSKSQSFKRQQTACKHRIASGAHVIKKCARATCGKTRKHSKSISSKIHPAKKHIH